MSSVPRPFSRALSQGFLLAGIWCSLWAGSAQASSAEVFDFLPCQPTSEFLKWTDSSPDLDFCSRWNPEFGLKGVTCCPKAPPQRKRGGRCAPSRAKGSYCDEITPDQKRYIERVQAGDWDALDLLAREVSSGHAMQAYCSVNHGFLAWGRPIVPTPANRIRLRSPGRCTSFGTDEMAALLEWTGRKIAEKYSEPEYAHVHLLVGDVSAPRGGCLAGRGGRRGHSSHTSGQDADLGFLLAKPNQDSPESFHRVFDAPSNWWFIKTLFQNPYVCVKGMFLDRKLIAKLSRYAASDPYWRTVRPYIKHVRGHRNHIHLRIGDAPGAPGCPMLGPDTEGEPEDEVDLMQSLSE